MSALVGVNTRRAYLLSRPTAEVVRATRIRRSYDVTAPPPKLARDRRRLLLCNEIRSFGVDSQQTQRSHSWQPPLAPGGRYRAPGREHSRPHKPTSVSLRPPSSRTDVTSWTRHPLPMLPNYHVFIKPMRESGSRRGALRAWVGCREMRSGRRAWMARRRILAARRGAARPLPQPGGHTKRVSERTGRRITGAADSQQREVVGWRGA